MSHVKLGLSMEIFLDPCRRFVQESFCGRVGLHQRFSEGPSTAEDPMIFNTDLGEVITETPRVSKHSLSVFWELAKPQDKGFFLGSN